MRTNLNLIDLTKSPFYERVSPYKCVISNEENDFVCHIIFVLSASDYFLMLFNNSDETCEIGNGVVVPRVRVNFADHLIMEYIRFAYNDEMKINTQNVEDLLEFSSFLNSTEMLALVEKFLCDTADSFSDNFDQYKDYFQIAEQYMLEQFKQKLISRSSVSTMQVGWL